MKKISVIMATYNCEKTVDASIESILNQTYNNFEFIICDDGSSDGTYNKLLKYKEKYPDKFVIVKNEKNSKLPYSLNHCLKYVTGDYVARMDADDISKPDRFKKQVEFLQSHPEYDLVSTGVEIFDGEKIVGTIILPETPDKMSFLHCGIFSHATIMTYPYVYQKLNGYSLDKYAERVEDQELWYRFFKAGFKGYGLQEILYTVLEDQDTYARRASFRERVNSFVTHRRGYKMLNMPIKYRYRPYRSLAKAFVPMSIYKKIHLKKHSQ